MSYRQFGGNDRFPTREYLQTKELTVKDNVVNFDNKKMEGTDSNVVYDGKPLLQSLEISGNSLFISDGNSVIIGEAIDVSGFKLVSVNGVSELGVYDGDAQLRFDVSGVRKLEYNSTGDAFLMNGDLDMSGNTINNVNDGFFQNIQLKDSGGVEQGAFRQQSGQTYVESGGPTSDKRINFSQLNVVGGVVAYFDCSEQLLDMSNHPIVNISDLSVNNAATINGVNPIQLLEVSGNELTIVGGNTVDIGGAFDISGDQIVSQDGTNKLIVENNKLYLEQNDITNTTFEMYNNPTQSSFLFKSNDTLTISHVDYSGGTTTTDLMTFFQSGDIYSYSDFDFKGDAGKIRFSTLGSVTDNVRFRTFTNLDAGVSVDGIPINDPSGRSLNWTGGQLNIYNGAQDGFTVGVDFSGNEQNSQLNLINNTFPGEKRFSSMLFTDACGNTLGQGAIVLEPSGSEYALNFYVKSGGKLNGDAPIFGIANEPKMNIYTDVNMKGNFNINGSIDISGQNVIQDLSLNGNILSLTGSDKTVDIGGAISVSGDKIESADGNNVLALSNTDPRLKFDVDGDTKLEYNKTDNKFIMNNSLEISGNGLKARIVNGTEDLRTEGKYGSGGRLTSASGHFFIQGGNTANGNSGLIRFSKWASSKTALAIDTSNSIVTSYSIVDMSENPIVNVSDLSVNNAVTINGVNPIQDLSLNGNILSLTGSDKTVDIGSAISVSGDKIESADGNNVLALSNTDPRLKFDVDGDTKLEYNKTDNIFVMNGDLDMSQNKIMNVKDLSVNNTVTINGFNALQDLSLNGNILSLSGSNKTVDIGVDRIESVDGNNVFALSNINPRLKFDVDGNSKLEYDASDNTFVFNGQSIFNDSVEIEDLSIYNTGTSMELYASGIGNLLLNSLFSTKVKSASEVSMESGNNRITIGNTNDIKIDSQYNINLTASGSGKFVNVSDSSTTGYVPVIQDLSVNNTTKELIISGNNSSVNYLNFVPVIEKSIDMSGSVFSNEFLIKDISLNFDDTYINNSLYDLYIDFTFNIGTTYTSNFTTSLGFIYNNDNTLLPLYNNFFTYDNVNTVFKRSFSLGGGATELTQKNSYYYPNFFKISNFQNDDNIKIRIGSTNTTTDFYINTKLRFVRKSFDDLITLTSS